MRIADRVAMPPVFCTIEQRIAARASGVDVISLGVGSPDLPPPPHIIDALCAAASRPDTHGYAGYFGTPALRGAIATYYARRFGVSLDPEREILPLLGSKEGLANMALAFVDPGDVVLAPDPGYPTYRMGAIMASAYHPLPLRKERGLPDLDAVPGDVAKRATSQAELSEQPAPRVAQFLAEAVAAGTRHRVGLTTPTATPMRPVALSTLRPGRQRGGGGVQPFQDRNMAGWRGHGGGQR